MKKQIVSFSIAFMYLLVSFSSTAVMATNFENEDKQANCMDYVSLSGNYLIQNQSDKGIWYDNSIMPNAYISECFTHKDLLECTELNIQSTIEKSEKFFDEIYIINVDTISNSIISCHAYNDYDLMYLYETQNPDGGFGLAEGYTSDIIDTKLALKALTDIGETEAMTNAALYISSLQNEDGGFGYQQGLSSNAYLTADIANILVDTIDVNPILSYYLEDTFTALDSYLDSTFPVLNELSSSDLDIVYQHFHTALYRLKRNGRYDVTPYYALQAEDGGVFDDPMATALYLELLVREQNALVAKIDNIAITNDRGYAVSTFNSNENVNISVINEFETDKAHFEMSIIKPDGTIVPLNGDIAIWNTTDNPDGEYTVRAEIIRNSNDEVTTSLEQTFRIQHRLAVDSIILALSQPYSRVGDKASVEVTAEFDISNFSEENQLAINWTVTDVSGEVLTEDTIEITEANVAMNAVVLGSFTPDTSERNAYIIKAELMSNDVQIAQTTTNYFV